MNRAAKIASHLCRTADERDLFHVLNEYLKHVPQEVKEATSDNPVRLLTHVKPRIDKGTAESVPVWFSKRSIGKTYFAQLFKESLLLAQIPADEVKITLRCMRATTITNLRASGEFTDAEIRTRTGHISDRALSSYERPSGKDLKRRLSAAILEVI